MKVTVLGDSILKPPLLESDDAKTIVIRDEAGRPLLLVVNIREDTWGVSSSQDKDWQNVLQRFGVK